MWFLAWDCDANLAKRCKTEDGPKEFCLPPKVDGLPDDKQLEVFWPKTIDGWEVP